jgi:hypothetical protein
MKKIRIVLIVIMLQNFGFAQSKSEIDSLLVIVSTTQNSKDISKSLAFKKIENYKNKALPILAEFFTNAQLTKVYSECQSKNLTKGEIAIIVADKIKMMPYAALTGVQNCLLIFCEKNPNFIEYYFNQIQERGIAEFQKKYIDWLNKG